MPTIEELAFIRANARGTSPTLTVAVLLKSLQRLGYLPRLQDVPFAIVTHIRLCLRLPADTALDLASVRSTATTPPSASSSRCAPGDRPRATSRWLPCTERRRCRITPADLINVAIEELVRQRYELPTWIALLDVRAAVHARLFALILGRLDADERRWLDALLETIPPQRSAFDALKQPPPRPSLPHLDALVSHLRWLEEFGDKSELLAGLTPAKVSCSHRSAYDRKNAACWPRAASNSPDALKHICAYWRTGSNNR
jgi:hypothetical protein